MNRIVLRLMCAAAFGLAPSVVAALASETAPGEAVRGRLVGLVNDIGIDRFP